MKGAIINIHNCPCFNLWRQPHGDLCSRL